MKRLVSKLLALGALVLFLAACSNPLGVFPEASVTQVSTVSAEGTFTVSGTNFFQYPSGAGMRVEVCGVTLPAEVVNPVMTEILLPPAGIIRVEVGEELTVTLPAGLVGGSGDLRIVRPDGQVTLVVGGVACPAAPRPDSTAVAALSADVTEGYAPLRVSFGSAGSSGEGALSFLWEFGDGTTSTESSALHTFTTAGEYTVTLSVTDETGVPDIATVLVTVLAPSVTSVTVTLDADELHVRQSAQAVAVVTTAGGAPDGVTWSSSDEAVLTVSEAGLVTAVGEGAAEVIATSTFDATRVGRAAMRITEHVFTRSTVLYVTDLHLGEFDAARVALEAARDEFGLTLVVSSANASSLSAALARNPDLVFYQTRGSATNAEDALAMLAWVHNGGRLVYGSWYHPATHHLALLAALSVTPTGSVNQSPVTVLDSGLLNGMSTATLALTPPSGLSWGTYATGFLAGPEATVLAEFADGDAALVAANDGRTIALGFFEDTVPAADGAALFTNLFERVLLAGDAPAAP